MYLPRAFAETDLAALDALFDRDAFVTLITVRDGAPEIAHLPVLYRRDGQRIELLGSLLGLNLVRNPGAAFSFATGSTWIFTIVAVVIVTVILRVSKQLAHRPWAITLGLILGGAVGNLGDRLFRTPGFARGHVVDFINYGGQFVGNVADIAIVVAAGGVIVLSFFGIGLDGQRVSSEKSRDTRQAEKE